MKKYTFGWIVKDLGYVEVPFNNYTVSMRDMKGYINLLSNAVIDAKCGWDSVEYKAMKHPNKEEIEEYMVLCVNGHGERWIHITGNSKGCNFSVLGENLW